MTEQESENYNRMLNALNRISKLPNAGDISVQSETKQEYRRELRRQYRKAIEIAFNAVIEVSR